eukprot:scaffold401_cov399-Prasinococcus_capsulatus_cf.AAC.29
MTRRRSSLCTLCSMRLIFGGIHCRRFDNTINQCQAFLENGNLPLDSTLDTYAPGLISLAGKISDFNVSSLMFEQEDLSLEFCEGQAAGDFIDSSDPNTFQECFAYEYTVTKLVTEFNGEDEAQFVEKLTLATGWPTDMCPLGTKLSLPSVQLVVKLDRSKALSHTFSEKPLSWSGKSTETSLSFGTGDGAPLCVSQQGSYGFSSTQAIESFWCFQAGVESSSSVVSDNAFVATEATIDVDEDSVTILFADSSTQTWIVIHDEVYTVSSEHGTEVQTGLLHVYEPKSDALEPMILCVWYEVLEQPGISYGFTLVTARYDVFGACPYSPHAMGGLAAQQNTSVTIGLYKFTKMEPEDSDSAASILLLNQNAILIVGIVAWSLQVTSSMFL